jgi:hypothetical protein
MSYINARACCMPQGSRFWDVDNVFIRHDDAIMMVTNPSTNISRWFIIIQSPLFGLTPIPNCNQIAIKHPMPGGRLLVAKNTVPAFFRIFSIPSLSLHPLLTLAQGKFPNPYVVQDKEAR